MADSSGLPVAPSAGALRPLGLGDVQLDGGFWGSRQAAQPRRDHPALPTRGRRGSGGSTTSATRTASAGREFADSDVYKLVEAMAWEPAAARPGSTRDRRDRGGDGRRAGGGRLPQHALRAPRPRAPLHRPRVGPRALLLRPHDPGRAWRACARAARTASPRSRCGPPTTSATPSAPTATRASAAIPVIEMALVELYRATGEERYLEQARLFVERRGRPALADGERGRAYYQDEMPIRDSAAPSAATPCGRSTWPAAPSTSPSRPATPSSWPTIERQWERTVARPHLPHRRHGLAPLPPRTSARTSSCRPTARTRRRAPASRRSSSRGGCCSPPATPATPTSPSARCTTSSPPRPALDGSGFFYANPLHQRVPGEAPDPDAESPRAASSLRAPWFHVSCCPTNVARTLASLARLRGDRRRRRAPAPPAHAVHGPQRPGRPARARRTTRGRARSSSASSRRATSRGG